MWIEKKACASDTEWSSVCTVRVNMPAFELYLFFLHFEFRWRERIYAEICQNTPCTNNDAFYLSVCKPKIDVFFFWLADNYEREKEKRDRETDRRADRKRGEWKKARKEREKERNKKRERS